VHDYSENKTVILINKDTITANLALSLEGPDYHDFNYSPASLSLPPNSSIPIVFNFKPSSPGKKTAWLDIKSNNCTAGIIIYLQGEGVALDAGEPGWDADPPAETPIRNRWQALGAVKSSIAPGYGIVQAHCPKTVWLNYPPKSAYIYYLDYRGCLWARCGDGKLYIYNLYNNATAVFDLGAGTNLVFALGNFNSKRDTQQICYWQDPNFIVFAESEWNGSIWGEPQEITRWSTGSGVANMIYWYPPNFLLLLKNENRLELWNEREGLVAVEYLDFPPHYATRDKNNRIWVSAEYSNKLININSSLEDKDIEIYAESRQFAGISTSSQFDIVAIDKANEELIIRLADEDYFTSYKVNLPGIQEGCARWEGGYCLFTTENDGFIGIHLRNAAIEDGSRKIVFGAFERNLNLRGDAGLLMYSEWAWKWQPNREILNARLIKWL